VIWTAVDVAGRSGAAYPP